MVEYFKVLKFSVKNGYLVFMKKIIFTITLSLIAFCQIVPQSKANESGEPEMIKVGKDKVKAVVKGFNKKNLELKAEAKEKSKTLMTIPNGSIVDVLKNKPSSSVDENTWFQIKYQNKTGWVNKFDLDFNSNKKRKITVKYGTFEGIEWGDYCHLKFKDEKGEDKSYWIFSTDQKKIKPLDIENEANTKKYIGKKIKLELIENIQWINECSCLYILDDVNSIELVK